MAKHLDRHSYLADRLYVGAFLAIAAWSILTISYLEGRADEAMRRYHEIDDQIDQEQLKAEYWQEKYDLLAHEAGYVAVLEAEAKFQGTADGR